MAKLCEKESQMWYVIQARSGEEEEIKNYIEHTVEPEVCRIILPLYEDVWRKGGIGHISIKKLFPGYLFVDTEDPDEVYRRIKSVPHFTRLLATEEKDKNKTFLAIDKEDEEFIKELTDEGLMHVSYIRRTKSGRIEKIKGPLSRFANKIVKLDVPHRRAIVEADIFGKHRRIKYALWTDDDPPLAWFEGKTDSKDVSLPAKTYDIGIHEGDKVIDETGTYADMVFTVKRVDPARRLIQAEGQFFGTTVRFELKADNVTLKADNT